MSVKEEYEALNNRTREGKNAIYQAVQIDDSVIDEMDIRTVIGSYENSPDSIIYFGAPWCPWCRLALPVLIEYAKAENKRISYCDLSGKRPVYKLVDGKAVLVDQGDNDYQLLIDAFKDIMEECTAYDDGKAVKIKGKYNIDLPLVVFGSFGTITGYHYGAVDLKEGQSPYDVLDDTQKEKLMAIFEERGKTKAGTCSLDGKCE